MTVTDAAGFAPANGYDQVIQVDDELMLVTAVSGNTLIVVRGYDSSVPTSHLIGDLVLKGGAAVLDPKTTTVAVANAAARSDRVGQLRYSRRSGADARDVCQPDGRHVDRRGAATTARRPRSTRPGPTWRRHAGFAAPSDFKMVLTQSSGNSFQATRYNLDTANTLGQFNFNMPPGVANLAGRRAREQRYRRGILRDRGCLHLRRARQQHAHGGVGR